MIILKKRIGRHGVVFRVSVHDLEIPGTWHVMKHFSWPGEQPPHACSEVETKKYATQHIIEKRKGQAGAKAEKTNKNKERNAPFRITLCVVLVSTTLV